MGSLNNSKHFYSLKLGVIFFWPPSLNQFLSNAVKKLPVVPSFSETVYMGLLLIHSGKVFPLCPSTTQLERPLNVLQKRVV